MRNIVASVRDRLLNIARREGIQLQRLLTLYMQEGLLHRIVVTGLSERVVLKGGLLLYHLHGLVARPTKDIDLLGPNESSDGHILREILEAACAVEIEDGLIFDAASVSVEPIRGHTEHGGVRGHVVGRLGSAKTRLQIDMGFGDVIVGGPDSVSYRSLLGDRSFSIRVYPEHTVVAEKLEAVVSLGAINSRTKDLYDLFDLLVTMGTSEAAAVEASIATFRHRDTGVSPEPQALSDGRWRSDSFEQTWMRFLEQIGQEAPSVDELRTKLLPRLQSIYKATREHILGGLS